MVFSRMIFLVAVMLLAQAVPAQKNKPPKLNKAEKTIVTNLQSHIAFLANDKLEGRRAGTNGERLAMEYISQKFLETGLQPKGTN